MIKNKMKVSKKVVIISGVIAIAVLITSVFISGLLNGVFFKEQSEEIQETIKLTYNGELITFKNKPIIENDMVYFPLEELLKKVNSKNYIKKEGQETVIYIENSTDYYRIKVGLKELNKGRIEQLDPVARSSAKRDTTYSPILKNKIVYIPYEYVKYILIDANGYNISGSSLYQNEKMNIQFEIPLDWSGEYLVNEKTEDWLFFNHKDIYDKYGEGNGILFHLHKVNDKDLEEELMIGNQTVLWQNEEYAYVLGRPTDVQYPTWSDMDREDILFAKEYQKMFSGITHIEQTFSLIKKVDTPVITNIEKLSYIQIRDLQRQVDSGHFPWRLDPEQVIMAFLSGKGVNVENGKITALTGGSEGVSATYSIGEKEYLIELFKPLDITEQGIWIVKTFQKKCNAIIQEVHFYERTPAQALINKQEDGWYTVPKHISAVLQYEGDKPYSISAYFTPTGTNMESEKKLVAQEVLGRTDTNISPTPARFPSLDIDFSEEDKLGHLWFVFTFEDGSSVVSEIYNMYIE